MASHKTKNMPKFNFKIKQTSTGKFLTTGSGGRSKSTWAQPGAVEDAAHQIASLRKIPTSDIEIVIIPLAETTSVSLEGFDPEAYRK